MSNVKIPFAKTMDFKYGEIKQISPMVRRIVARNPSNFTCYGTNTYIIGHSKVSIIDPGPALDEHIRALAIALKGEEVENIVVTHTHNDHSSGVKPLVNLVGGKIWGAKLKLASKIENREESIDWDFSPDHEIINGMKISGNRYTLEAVHTPGHMSNHMCFSLKEENILFTGDHIMGWNTTIISPPDGNMRDYFESLETCLARTEVKYWPAHGPEISNPRPFTRAYRNHRRIREGQILRCLDNGLTSIQEVVAALYTHIPIQMHKAAERSVLAHMEHLVETGRAYCEDAPKLSAKFRKARK